MSISEWRADILERKLDQQKDLLISVERGLRTRKDNGRSSEPASRPGEKFFLRTAAELLRVAHNEAGSARLIDKAATTVATTFNTGWAAELSKPGGVSAYLLGQPQSALAAILRRSPQISMVGEGQTRIPVGSPPPPATIVAEGAPIPVSKGAFTSAAMVPWKVASILTATEELLNAPNAEQILRLMLDASVSSGLDLAAFSATPPAGLLQGLVPITPSTATEASIAVLEDLSALAAALVNPSSETVFVMSPPSLIVASAWIGDGLPYAMLASSALPKGKVVAIDPLGIAASLPAEARTTITEGGAIHESDAPLPIADAAGTLAAPVRSLFQTNTYSLRLIVFAAWAARPGSTAFMTGAKW